MALLANDVQKNLDGKDVVIRSARTSDASALNAFVSDVFKTSDYLITQPHEFSFITTENQVERIRSYDVPPGHLLLVAECDGKLIGTLDFASGNRDRTAHRGEFGMSVRRDWRGRGIGKMLMEALIEWVRTNPVVELILLQVFEENAAAIALYKKFGFQITGREPHDIRLAPGIYAPGLRMSLHLPK